MTPTHRRNVPAAGFLVWLALTHAVHARWWNGGPLVDQCLSEAVSCLALVLLWAGRWDGYPYLPSGEPGMGGMQLLVA